MALLFACITRTTNNIMSLIFTWNTEEAGLCSAFEMANCWQRNFPKSKTRLVDAWIEIHREELEADWKLAVNNEEVFKIDPLK